MDCMKLWTLYIASGYNIALQIIDYLPYLARELPRKAVVKIDSNKLITSFDNGFRNVDDAPTVLYLRHESADTRCNH